MIGFFSLVTLVSTFKFLWAPFIDRTRVPVLTSWLGHRRSWMLVCQVLIMLGLWLVAGSDPSRSLGTIAVFAVLVGFSSATQDIAIDAWRIEAAETSKQGAMAAAYQWGYRVAIIVAGAVPLLLAAGLRLEFLLRRDGGADDGGRAGGAGGAARGAPRHPSDPDRGHSACAGTRGARMGRPPRDPRGRRARAGLGSRRQCRRARRACSAPWAPPARATAVLAAWASAARVWVHLAAVVSGFGVIVLAALPLPGARTRPGVYLSSALADPLRDFFSRYRSAGGLILALICLYRIPDFVLNIMNPFYLDLGYSLVEIAEVRKIFGVGMTMFGVFAGGVAVARYGLLRAMVIGAFAGPLSNLLFIWLAMQDHSLCALFAAHRPRQRRWRLRGHVPDRVHVEPDIGRVHRDAIRALFLALRDSRPPGRVAVRPHRRGCRAAR